MSTPEHDTRTAATAAMLEVTDAARAYLGVACDVTLADDQETYWKVRDALADAVEHLDAFCSELIYEPAHVWRPTTWREVAELGAGTRVRLGGVEAVVESAMAGRWHTDPASNPRWPKPLEWDVIDIRLVGRPDAYHFPPENSVEVQDVVTPTVTEADWAAAAVDASVDRAVRLLAPLTSVACATDKE